MVYLVDSSYVVVMILIALLVFVLVAYLIVRMFAQNSKKDENRNNGRAASKGRSTTWALLYSVCYTRRLLRGFKVATRVSRLTPSV